MTSNFFAIWANQINKWEKKEESHSFFIDSFQAHCITPEIKAVKIVFLPSNIISEWQTFAYKLVRNFKLRYRQEVVQKIVDAIAQKEEIMSLNTHDCKKMPNRVQRNVMQKTTNMKAVINPKMKYSMENGGKFQNKSLFPKTQLSKISLDFIMECGTTIKSFLYQFLLCHLMMRKKCIFSHQALL